MPWARQHPYVIRAVTVPKYPVPHSSISKRKQQIGGKRQSAQAVRHPSLDPGIPAWLGLLIFVLWVCLHILFIVWKRLLHSPIVSHFRPKPTLLCGLTEHITLNQMQNGIPYLPDSVIDHIPFDLVWWQGCKRGASHQARRRGGASYSSLNANTAGGGGLVLSNQKMSISAGACLHLVLNASMSLKQKGRQFWTDSYGSFWPFG